MREIGRTTGVHASTVIRYVRKIENNAENPKIQALIGAAEAAPMDIGHYVGAENRVGEKIPAYHWRGIGGIQGDETGSGSAPNR